jgi:saccharopine dehydrogenase-like NADP-dependent oxidoreductase
MKKVLLLGAGMVTRPIVHYLLDREDIQLTVASRTVSKAEELVKGHPRGTAIALNVTNDEELENLVATHDLSISLVPYTYHVKVAKLCIKHKKDMVTTSYISADMRALDGAAKEAGVLLLNELGVDPGIDHMSAMKIIHAVEREGGKVVSFRSYCGGLPAPEANTNPWGYKFSWAPRGVVLAARNNAKFLWDGKVVDVPTERLFLETHILNVEGIGDLECYPNRDSMGYIELYGLKDIQTMFRGTLRNLGWCSLWTKIKALNLLDLEEFETNGMTYKAFMAKLAGCQPSDNVKAKTAAFLDLPVDAPEVQKLEWVGLFEDKPIPNAKICALDVLADLLLIKLAYAPRERDLIVLHHEFVAEYPGRRERITSSLVDFGIPGGDTSMARTVSLPAAIGTAMILDGKITVKGVHLPTLPEFYEPILAELETMDIVCKEKKYPL